MANWTAENIEDQTGRVAIVTGANTGIGYITALELARKGATVIVAGRSEQRCREAVERIEAEQIDGDTVFMPLDLASMESIRAFAEDFNAHYDRLDLLVNNAGVMMPPRSETKDGFELQIGTNHLGHFALGGLLIDRLISTPGSRVVTVSSMAHSRGEMDFDDLHSRNKKYGRLQSYAQSKLANLLFTYELQRRFEAAGVSTIAVAAHPGWTSTDLQRHVGVARFLNRFVAQQPWQGALPTLFAAVDPSVRGGHYIGPNGRLERKGYPTQVEATPAARNLEDASRLWAISVDSVGVGYEALDSAPADGPPGG